MAVPNPPHSSHEGDNFEMVVDYYFDLDGTDAKPGPMDPAIRRKLEAERENVEKFVAWTKREQEKLNARRRSQPKTNDDVRPESDLDSDDKQGFDKAG